MILFFPSKGAGVDATRTERPRKVQGRGDQEAFRGGALTLKFEVGGKFWNGGTNEYYRGSYAEATELLFMCKLSYDDWG